MKTAAFSAAELRFWGWIPRAPDLSDFYAKGRGGLQPGASRDCRPPWGPARKPTTPLGVSHGEVRKPTTPPGLLHDEARKPTARPDFFTAKRESRQWRSPLPGRGFFGRAAGRNGALPYSARKSQFLRNGDVRATESLFLFAVLWLAFLPDQSETGVAGGEKARRPETPAAPRRPRPTTATGSRFLRRQRERPPRRPRPSPPAREGSLGAPNDRTFPPGAERKARKEKGKEDPG